ncbi:hypothetical protein BKA56DRAFT_587858 [Ilyonectria sp. MPI-CAGE-AT-0026]|nr:hypothetical protein BKA56DRAFT_587858 [Ilyonectria sp. MPI-CAGE-AT-0026]
MGFAYGLLWRPVTLLFADALHKRSHSWRILCEGETANLLVTLEPTFAFVLHAPMPGGSICLTSRTPLPKAKTTVTR